MPLAAQKSLAAQKVAAINKRLERLMPILTPLGIALGFFLPGIFIHLRPFVPWLFGLMTLSGALNLRVRELGGTIVHPIPILAFFISTHVIMPLFAMLTSSLFFGSNPDTVAGFILLFSGPAAVSSFIWVAMFRGDPALCLTLILLDAMLAPIVLPGTVSLLIGAKVTMDMSGIALSLVLMVVIPTIIGVTLNEASHKKIPHMVCPYLAPVAKICLMLVIAANTAPVGKIIRFDDLVVRQVAGLCIMLSVVGFLLSKVASIIVKGGTPRSVSLFFSGGLRNISAVTTIAVTFFPEATALPALLGIMFQQTLSAIMGKLCIDVDHQH